MAHIHPNSDLVGNRQPVPMALQYSSAYHQVPECVSPDMRLKPQVVQLTQDGQQSVLHVPLQLFRPDAQPQPFSVCPSAAPAETVIVPAFCALVQPFEFFTVTVKAVLLLNCWVVIVLAGVVLVEPPIFQV